MNDNRGASIVAADEYASPSVQVLVHAINQALGNIGEGKALLALQSETKGLGTLATLKQDIDSGAVEILVLLTPSNPVYDAPADLGFASSLAKLKTSIHLGERTDAERR